MQINVQDWLEVEFFLNKLAQGQCSWESGLSWFSSLECSHQGQILERLLAMVLQAGGNQKLDSSLVIEKSGLRPTFTPCVLLAKGRADKLSKLNPDENGKSFKLLITWLNLADSRRREQRCRGSCSHWWHQELTDSFLETLRVRYPHRLLESPSKTSTDV